MELLSGHLAEDSRALDEILGVTRNYDMTARTLVVGGRAARLYFLDGYGKDEVIERVLSVWLALSPEQLLSAEKSLTRKAEGMYPPVCQLAERPAAAKKTDSAFLM